MGRIVAFLLAVLAVAGASASGADPDTRRSTLHGARAGGPIEPQVIERDLRDLPISPGGVAGFLADVARLPEPPTSFGFESPLVAFPGLGFTGASAARVDGDVGPHHYVQAVENQTLGARVVVYDKLGTVVAGPFDLASLGTGGACADDPLGVPVVLYDSLADRWLLSEETGYDLCFYVSRTGDPVTGGWYRYVVHWWHTPTYEKLGVWPDAYYVAIEQSSEIFALDRNRMLAGLSLRYQWLAGPPYLAGFSGHQGLVPADLDGPLPPPNGAPGLLMRHRDDELHNPPGTPGDFLEVWEYHVDWSNPAASTLRFVANVPVSEFDSDLHTAPQPGGWLAASREEVMNRLQYRNFGTHQSLVSNLATDVGGEHHGVRWFALRKAVGSAWSLHQEGTYAPDADHRAIGSAAMDRVGNLAVGYRVSGPTTPAGLRYAGRLAADPPGTLPRGEHTLVDGLVGSTWPDWGFKSSLSVDPSDDCTFWYTGQYAPVPEWGTWIASFRFDGCLPPDFSVTPAPASLTVLPKGGATTTLTVRSLEGFESEVTFSASGLPSGATASFSTNPVTPPAGHDATTILTLATTAATPTGNYSVLVRATAGALTRYTSVNLKVVGPVFFDAALRAPKCPSLRNICDSGPLLVGRGTVGPEPNQPNTIAGACADRSAGTFHVDESLDRLVVYTTSGGTFATGRTVRIEATVWAYSSFASDKLDLYYAANANAPVWTYLTTLTPTMPGPQVLAHTYLLPSGGLQAVRGRFRYGGTSGSCGAGSYDDHDDLVFPVALFPTP